MLEDKPLVELKFPLGKDNVSRETNLPEGAVRELLNADVHDSGAVSLREGYTQVYDGGGDLLHSLFSTDLYTVFGQANTLRKLNAIYGTETLRSDLDPNQTISYTGINDRIYYSNGIQSGVITEDGQHAEWGVPNPGQPTLGTTTGVLAEGTYQVAITYVSTLGEESGTGLAATIDIAEGEGIQLVTIPQGNAAFVNVYVSPPNGDTLYHHIQLPMGVTSGVIPSTLYEYGRALETQFMERMPAGSIVRYYRGRMWVASENVLIFSPSMRYGLYDPRFTYFIFPADITMVQPVVDGLYVAADKTYFLGGTDPNDMRQIVVSPDKVIPNTGISVDPDVFSDQVIKTEIPDDVAFWFSVKGAMLGLPGGATIALTDDRLNIAEYGRGATLFREENGIRQLVTTLTNKGPSSGFGATDVAIAEIRQNGVVL